MRLVVFSDSHRRVSSVLEIFERHKDNADLFIFLGDGNVWTHGKLIKASGLANPIQITLTNGTY